MFVSKLFYIGSDTGCEVLHGLGGHLNMVGEIEVAGFVERHQMDMCMRHVDTDDRDTDFDTGAGFLEAFGHLAAELMQIDKEVVVEVEDIIHLFLGDAEHVARDNGVDVEEGETVVGLCDLVAGDFTCHYSGKNGWHRVGINGFSVNLIISMVLWVWFAGRKALG